MKKYFSVYISKLLKNKKSITLNAKEQLNSLLCIFAKKISIISSRIVSYSKRRMIMETDVRKACLSMGLDVSNSEKILGMYKNNKDKKGSRQSKASLTFSVSLCESFLKENNNFSIHNLSPVLLCYVLEKIATIILFYDDQKRITIKSIYMGIHNTYLSKILEKYKIQLLSGCVPQYIHSSLLPIKNNKISFVKKRDYDKNNVIKEIKRLQKTFDSVIFAKLPFEVFVKSIFSNYKDCRIQNNLILVIQYYVEQYLINILNKVNLCAIHSNRTKVILKDFELYEKI